MLCEVLGFPARANTDELAATSYGLRITLDDLENH